MRKISLITLLFFVFVSSIGAKDSTHVQLRYRISGTAGWLNRDDKIAGTKSMKGLTMDRPVVMGGTVAVEFLPTGRLRSLQQWNNASIGLAAGVIDLGQDRYLGQIIPVYSYLNVPLVHTPHFILGLRPGIGMAFATKRYANTVPADKKWEEYKIPIEDPKYETKQIANISVGSVLNAFLIGEIYMDFPIRDGWALTLSGGWQHASNGSVMTPNGGYNMFNAELGIAYTPGEDSKHSRQPYAAPAAEVPHRLYDGVEKKWMIEVGALGGTRSVYYRDRKWFGVADINLAAYWQPVSIFRLGGGVDVFYDGAYAAVYNKFASLPENESASITYFKKTYLKNSDSARCWRVGFSIQPEMVLGNLTIGYHVGFYLYDPVKNLEPFEEAEAGTLNRGIFYSYDPSRVSTYQDGWCYQRVSLKYHLPHHLYVQMGLKLHIMKAEFIGVGLGAWL